VVGRVARATTPENRINAAIEACTRSCDGHRDTSGERDSGEGIEEEARARIGAGNCSALLAREIVVYPTVKKPWYFTADGTRYGIPPKYGGDPLDGLENNRLGRL
jgi:hypothetical protein